MDQQQQDQSATTPGASTAVAGAVQPTVEAIQPTMEAMSLEQPHQPVEPQQGQPLPPSLTQADDDISRPTLPLTSEALAAQNSQDAHSGIQTGVAIAAATQHVPELHLQRSSPVPSDQQQQQQQQGPVATKPRGSVNRAHMLAEIPSAFDLYGGDQRSPSPSRKSHSVASSNSDTTAQSSGRSSVNENKQRFEKLPNGGHRHHLSAPKRHQYLTTQVRRLRGLLDGGKREREREEKEKAHALHREALEHPLSLLHEKMQDFENDREGRGLHHHRHRHQSSSVGGARKHDVKGDFVGKYGDLQQVVGRGAFGTVRLSIKKDPETGEEIVFAIKEFKHDNDESQKKYMRRLTSEFCIASSLKHVNVIQTLDLLQLHGDAYSEVMEYCSGGDMHSLIASANMLGEAESSCFFAQLINGVAFLHSMGVVHRDLKPENLLLTADGCIKIADFGNSEVFRMPWEKKVRSSTSIRGSGPFIAPEEFTSKAFDGRKVDMWSCGIIYMCMRLGRYNWAEASKGDPNWENVLYKIERWQQMREALPEATTSTAAMTTEHEVTADASHSGLTHATGPHVPKFIHLAAIEATTRSSLGWPDHIAEVINHLLDPNTKTRWQAGHVLDSEWMESIDNCHPVERPADQVLDESDVDPTPSQRVGSKVLEIDSDVTGYNVMSEVKSRRAKEGVKDANVAAAATAAATAAESGPVPEANPDDGDAVPAAADHKIIL
ncbi:hypothetical protein EDD11_002578 [Mortierella claussenii]|nr:hypothetical protein EDD11_002578 [Mortierella claussenii]